MHSTKAAHKNTISKFVPAEGDAGHEQVQLAAGQAGHAAHEEHVSDGQLGAAGQLGTEALVTKPCANALTPSESERSTQLGPMHKHARNVHRAWVFGRSPKNTAALMLLKSLSRRRR